MQSTIGLVGYDARLTRERSPVRSRDRVFGRVAQMVEHGSNKPRVVGSSPTVTTFYVFEPAVQRGARVGDNFPCRLEVL